MEKIFGNMRRVSDDFPEIKISQTHFFGRLIGLLAVAAIICGSCGSAWLPTQFSDLGIIRVFRALPTWLNRLFVAAGLVGFCVAFWLVRPRHDQRSGTRWTLALWASPFLISPPILSRDVYAYVDQGWQVLHGFDIYAQGMGTVGPFQALVDKFWQGTTPMYPPLSLQIQAAVVWASGDDVIRSVLLMRLPTLVAVGFLAWLLPKFAARLAPDSPSAEYVLWCALLNPITVIHVCGGAHNDAIMVALVIAALYVAMLPGRVWWRWMSGAVLVGAATSIKQPAALAALGVALAVCSAGFVKRSLVAVATIALAAATFVALTLLSGMGFGWLHATGTPTKAYTQAPACLLKIIGKSITPIPEETWASIFTLLGLVMFVCVVIWLWWRSTNPVYVVGWGMLAYCVCGPSLQPWYLTCALALLALLHITGKARAALIGWGVALLSAQYCQEVWGAGTLPSGSATLVLGAIVGWFYWRYVATRIVR